MSHIITIFGGKDGVGKSVFASNFAVAYLKQLRKKVLLLDLDSEHCGDISLIFAQALPRPLAMLSKSPKLDIGALQNVIVRHNSGLELMQGWREKFERDQVNPTFLDKVLRELSRNYDLIIIDGGARLTPNVVKVFELSDAIFVVSPADVLALSQTKKTIDEIKALLFPKEMIKIILNRYSQKSVITPQAIQKHIDHTLFAAIAEDEETCAYALAHGQPFALYQARSQVAQGIYQLVAVMESRKVLESLHALKKPLGSVRTLEEVAEFKATGTEGRVTPVYRRGARHEAAQDPRTQLKLRIHNQLTEEMNLKKLSVAEVEADPNKKSALQEKAKKAILALLEKEDTSTLSHDERKRVVQEILDEALGLGPLETLLADEAITEIMVNAKDQIYVEKNGKIVETNLSFTSDNLLLTVIERIVAPIGRRIDEQTPYCDARLPDGSRVHAIIPPLSIQGPMLTIRKFSKIPLQVEDLIRYATFNNGMAEFFKACIQARLNIVISGGTGTGKTTLLNVLSSYIPSTERIITIEDSAELQLNQPHVARLEARSPNVEGKGAVTIRDLVKNTLRMRPDRIVVGECRSGEALDMLQAMNTGHDGSLTTVHANSPRDCLSRLETLVMMAGMDLPARAIREQISSAIDIIVQIARLSDGSRKVVQVTEVAGMEGDVITLQDIFIFQRTGISADHQVLGQFKSTGFVPRFVEELKLKGIILPEGLFSR